MSKFFSKFCVENIMLIFFMCFPVLRALVFSKISGGPYFMIAMLVMMIVYVFFKHDHRKHGYFDIIILYLVIFFLFLIKFVYDESVDVWLERDYGVSYALLMGGVFAYAVIRLQKNVESMIFGLKVAAFILAIYYAYMSLEPIQVGYWTYTQFGHIRHSPSHMSWSYGVLLVISIFAIYVVDENKIFMIVPIIIGFIGILLYGSRGTIMSFIIGLLVVVLFYEKKKITGKKAFWLTVIVSLALFFTSSTGLELLQNILDEYNLRSRFITSVINAMGGETFENESTGRLRIWTHALDMINEQPFGYGVFGQRNSIYNLGIKWGYAHEFFLDILLEFGVVFGMVLIILFIRMILKFFSKVTNSHERIVFIVFLTVSCELLVSGSFWIHYGIWSLMALYVNHFKNNWQVTPEDKTLKKTEA
ncbi:MAG: O-antigen ligase family protein [Ruminococcus sp.]|nr:O-antigen ligase family protein [Ruminococcus sp.]